MNVKTLAAAAATIVALSAGSAFAWDLHDTLAPPSNPTPVSSQSYSHGADLGLPGSGSVSVRGAAHDYQCSEAQAKHPAGSPQITTFCEPGAR